MDDMQTRAYCANPECPVHPEVVPEDSALQAGERQPCPVCGAKSRLYSTFPTSALTFGPGATGSIKLSGGIASSPTPGASGSIELNAGPTKPAMFQATSSLTLGGKQVSPAVELIARATLSVGGTVSATAHAAAESTATAEASVLPAAAAEAETAPQTEADQVRNDAALIDAVLAELVAPEGSVLAYDTVTMNAGITRALGEIAADHEVTIRLGHLDEPDGAVVITVLSRYKGLITSGIGLTAREAILGVLEALLPGYPGESNDTTLDDA